jgi:hypothetical protein
MPEMKIITTMIQRPKVPPDNVFIFEHKNINEPVAPEMQYASGIGRWWIPRSPAGVSDSYTSFCVNPQLLRVPIFKYDFVAGPESVPVVVGCSIGLLMATRIPSLAEIVLCRVFLHMPEGENSVFLGFAFKAP